MSAAPPVVPPAIPARDRVLRTLDWAFPPREVADRHIASVLPEDDSHKPPLLFVHGAAHGAWCWQEHWMPAVAEQGWSTYAVDLRGHGRSGGDARRATLRDYEHDVLQAIVTLPAPPVLVGHSMGGLVVQRVLERYPAPAGVLVAPVPVRHGLGIAAAVARRHPSDLLRVAAGRSLPMRPDYLFSAEQDPRVAAAYCARTTAESPWAQYEIVLPRRARASRAPVLVLGGAADGLVPPIDVVRTARHYGTRAHLFRGMGHDLMLEPRWRQPLDVMLRWLDAVVTRPPRGGVST